MIRLPCTEVFKKAGGVVINLVKLCIFALIIAAVLFGKVLLPEPAAGTPAVRIPVLAYHSVMSREFYYPINVPNPWILSEEVFYGQMRFLYENDFTTLTVQQLKDFLFYGGELPLNPVILTFDDGYLDNYLFAAPILRQFGFTAMMFLITSAISEETPQMVVYPTQFMSEAEIITSMDVFEHGSHSHDMHRRIDGRPVLTFESAENIRADLLQSFEGPLTFRTGFAYPFGGYGPTVINVLKEEGVRFAFSTHEGFIYRDSNPFVLPRFSVTSDWTMDYFIQILYR
ncbi:MAG: polysaccharide deacetylase family protein [Defluviitaleaceae bacterium]|nr:polysaccharide deacetylase family protein [Defluviitaleaceae bacterium]